jgi:hypothetical protein
MAKVLTEALDLSCQKVETGNEGDLDRMSLVLAWCESFYRAGIGTVVDGNLGKQLRTAENGAGLLDSIEPRMIADIAALRVSAVPQVNSWNAEVTDGARFEPNPNFVGSDLVGGADADWMVGDVLIDCKTSERLTNPWIRNTLFQLLGYTLLDFEDSLHIRQLAIWVPGVKPCSYGVLIRFWASQRRRRCRSSERASKACSTCGMFRWLRRIEPVATPGRSGESLSRLSVRRRKTQHPRRLRRGRPEK